MQILSLRVPVLCGLLALPATLAAQHQVIDINKIAFSGSSSPSPGTTTRNFGGRGRPFAKVGIWTYFRASGGVKIGTELYRTLGGMGSTKLVADLNPGSPNSSPDYLTAVGSKLFFSATGPFGTELYVSDLITNKTTVIDIWPGKTTSGSQNSSKPQNLRGYKGECFFAANNGTSGTELWKSNGTAAGTKLVADIRSGSGSSSPAWLKVYKNELYFNAVTASNGRELWKTDGTTTNTKLLKDIRLGTRSSMSSSSSFGPWLEEMNGLLYFGADDGKVGNELWQTDGTVAGTKLTHDISTAISSSPQYMTAIGKTLYMRAGGLLYKTDGTKLTQITGVQVPYDLVAAGTKLWLGGLGTTGGTELFRYDGKALTRFDLNTTSSTASSNPNEMTPVGTNIVFYADDGKNGNELWCTNGTAAGTSMVKDIYPGTDSRGSANSSLPSSFTPITSTSVLFSATDDTPGTGKGRELWRSDCTAKGTVLADDIDPEVHTKRSSPSNLFHTGKRLFFSADDGKVGSELWTSDGTPAGTKLVADLDQSTTNSLPSGSRPRDFRVVGDKLFFTASNGTNTNYLGNEPHALDLKTMKVAVLDIHTGSQSSGVQNYMAYRGRMFFVATSSTLGTELVVSDGTVAGTKMLDLRPGKDSSGRPLSSSPLYLQVYKGELYFRAMVSTLVGFELYKLDANLNLKLVKDIWPGVIGSSPKYLTCANGKLFMSAGDSTNGTELVVFDGTNTTTINIYSTFSGPRGSSNPSPGRFQFPEGNHLRFAVANHKVFFKATTSSNGEEIHVSDGTKAGTFMLADIRRGTSRSSVNRVTPVGKRVFFTANDGSTGTELYVSDGTQAGTKLVKDIWPGSFPSLPLDLTTVGDRYCYFRAQVPTKEHELWRSDGTTAGTVEVLDIWPGAPGGNPSWMMVMGDSLFVHGIDPLKGSELMKVSIDALADHVGDGCAGGTNHPRLHITDPVLNKQTTITATGAPAGARGVMFAGPVASPEQLLGGNCTSYVDLNNLVFLMFFNPVGGSYKLVVNVPNDNNLIGLCIPLQVAYGPTSTVPFGLDLTNGVFLSADVK